MSMTSQNLIDAWSILGDVPDIPTRMDTKGDSSFRMNNMIIDLIGRVYEVEGYDQKPIGEFMGAYLGRVERDVACEWLIREGFFQESLDGARNTQSFFKLVCKNITSFNKAKFEKLLSIIVQEHQLYMLCKLHQNNYKFHKPLYKKGEFVKKFEDMCSGDEKVLEMPILKKRPISGGTLKKSVSEVFMDLCITEKMFDKWVGKQTILSEGGICSFNVKDETKLSFLKKWVSTNCSINLRVPKLIKNEKSLVKILDIFLNSRHKRNSSNSENIKRVLEFMGALVRDGEFDKELFEMKVIQTSTVKKSVANNISKRYAEFCPNYLAYKKL